MFNEEIWEGFDTRYALTKGVQRVKVRVIHLSEGAICYTVPEDELLKYGLDFHRSEYSARKRAVKMARNRVKSLNRQLVRMMELTINPRMAE